MIKVPAPPPDSNSVWSLALSWELNTQKISGIIEDVPDADIKDMVAYIAAKAHQVTHPLLLTSMILDILVVRYLRPKRLSRIPCYCLKCPSK